MPFSISTQSYLGIRPKGSEGDMFGYTPDWSVIPSKAFTSWSREELLERIANQAKKDAQTGDYYGRGARQLEAAYLSPVSPDRKALYKEIAPAIPHIVKAHKGMRDGHFRTLLDYIGHKNSGGGYGAALGYSGARISTDQTGQPVMIHVNSTSTGESMTLYHGALGGRWMYQPTAAEEIRSEEFRTLYLSAYRAAKKGPLPDGKTLNILA